MSNRRSIEFILSWNISQMITKTVPISMGIVISNAMKLVIPLWMWWKVNGNWDNGIIRISQLRENHCRTNASIRRKKEIQRRRTVRITVWDLCRKVNHLSKVVWDFTRSISSTRIGKPVIMDVEVSKDEKFSRWVDLKSLIYIKRNRIKSHAQIWRRWSIEEKEIRCWVK